MSMVDAMVVKLMATPPTKPATKPLVTLKSILKHAQNSQE